MAGFKRGRWVDDGKRDPDLVFDPDMIARCIVDRRPGGCIEVSDGVWLRCEWIIPREPEWSPYP